MGQIFRSDKMALAQIFLQPESAYRCMSALGEAGIVQFRDLAKDKMAQQKIYINEVVMCNEFERQLNFIEHETVKEGIKIPQGKCFPTTLNPRYAIDLEAHLSKTEGEIETLNKNLYILRSNYIQLVHMKHVLENTRLFFRRFSADEGLNAQIIRQSIAGQQTPNQLISAQQNINEEFANQQFQNQQFLIPLHGLRTSLDGSQNILGFIAGALNRQKILVFESMLWRLTKGNILLKHAEIECPLKDLTVGGDSLQNIFLIFYQGDQIKSKILKICNGFNASVYSCPNSFTERERLLNDINVKIEDIEMVLKETQDHRQRLLEKVAKEMFNWTIMVQKMKAIYHMLNYFTREKYLIGECWIPECDIETAQQYLLDCSEAGGSAAPSFLNIIETKEDPPTYNRTNKFTKGFQSLINAYGIATYQEINPGLYTIITFPFLFAIMFGDLGHGFILFFFALCMILLETKTKKQASESEFLNLLFKGRYIILLMGCFSMYTGIIYNDVFSKSINLFNSHWHLQKLNFSQLNSRKPIMVDPKISFEERAYFTGIDPIWQFAKNKIVFLNSYKMKLSIIFGVFHMMFGLCLNIFNYIHFKKYSKIFLVFIPQLIFLVSLFLWMVIMIFMKYILYGPKKTGIHSTACAPSILILFINMVLFKHSKPAEGCEEYMFDSQEHLQQLLVLFSILCIPVMLLGEPLYIKYCRHRLYKRALNISDVEREEGKVSSLEDKESMNTIFINQAIHTVEYALSTVSHTASYLRLWALSLAHAQLSEVLYSMIIGGNIYKYFTKKWPLLGGVLLWVLFMAWAAATIAILVVMEGLSAFLHTLRLHWVEFMSKFYMGQGYRFMPFSFKTLIEKKRLL